MMAKLVYLEEENSRLKKSREISVVYTGSTRVRWAEHPTESVA